MIYESRHAKETDAILLLSFYYLLYQNPIETLNPREMKQSTKHRLRAAITPGFATTHVPPVWNE
jgi:hypothetical protein